MHKHIYLFSMLWCPYLVAQDIDNTQKEPRILVEQIVLQTVINQRTKLDEKLQETYGNRLIQYLNTLDNETFKASFAALPFRAKIMYMLTIDTQEYELFLERYSDQEWQTFWCTLSPEEQLHIPKTRTEQLTLIRDAYYVYYERNFSSWISNPEKPAPYPSDLKRIKKFFYKDSNSYGEKIYNEKCLRKRMSLSAYMHRERLKLFNM